MELIAKDGVRRSMSRGRARLGPLDRAVATPGTSNALALFPNSNSDGVRSIDADPCPVENGPPDARCRILGDSFEQQKPMIALRVAPLALAVRKARQAPDPALNDFGKFAQKRTDGRACAAATSVLLASRFAKLDDSFVRQKPMIAHWPNA